MKARWLVFGGAEYYASGGARDFIGEYQSEAQAIAVAADPPRDADGDRPDWAHVARLNSDGLEVIYDNGSAHA